MYGPNADGFFIAMEPEYNKEKTKKARKIPIETTLNVLGSTWIFKVKRYTDGAFQQTKSSTVRLK
jgi:hypothetical protein